MENKNHFDSGNLDELHKIPEESINIGSSEMQEGLQELSNLSPTEFTFEGVFCASAEGAIQALKYENEDEQKRICTLFGGKAKRAGKKGNKRIETELSTNGKAFIFWKGGKILFRSPEHFNLIKEILMAKFTQNESAKSALLKTGNSQITHDMGYPESTFTSLPAKVFTNMLHEIRNEIQKT